MIVQELYTSLPAPTGQGPTLDQVRDAINNISHEANLRSEADNEQASAEVRAAAEEGRAGRERLLSRFGIRLMLGGGIFAGALALVVGVGPRLLRSWNPGDMFGLPAPPASPSPPTPSGTSGFWKAIFKAFKDLANGEGDNS
jgi:hypothetical protein